MAANTPPGNAAPLGRLAVELLEHVKFFLEDSVRDMVALDYALYGKNIGQKMSMDYKELAVKHSRNLLMTAALCQQISYDGNDKAKWDKMRLRPSPWTNLPTDHTYLTMIRIERYRPQHDLRGNPISLQDIKRFYEEEQMEERRRLVFQTRVQRSGGGYPSPESREKIGMADADARRYSELLQHATPGTAEYRIIMECMEDEERARQDRVGQHAAFRRLFYKVVTDPEIQPGVCMSCLAPNAAAWILVRKTGNITVRFCEGCTLPFARARQVTLIGPDQLEPLFIKGIGQQDYPWAPEKHELKILNGLYFGENRAYLFKDAASKLCKLVHGHSYDALLAHPLSEEVLKTNAALYRHAKTVAEYVLHEASKGSPWKKLQVNTASFEFWTLAVVYARHTIASDPKMRILGHIPSHTLWDVARDFWKEFLLRKRQRYLKEDAREKFHVVVIDKIESLRSNVADPLDEDTISVDKLEQLSHRIHGKSANDARKDPVTLLQHNRLRFEMASAGLVEVIDRFDSAALEVLIDVVGITCANHLDEALDSRDRRLGIFLDAYYRSVHIDPRGLCSFSNVSKERARSMADAFLYHLMNSSIWPSACEWTVGKKVFSYLQVDRESIHNIVAPTFIVEWANVCGVTVLSRFDRPPPDAQQCGRLYWTLADPDYLTTDDAAMADTPMEDGPTGDDYMADVMAGWDREHEF